MNNNYLDIEANGNVVKKSIEEICHNISQNVLENNGKFFKLKVDTENTYEDELDAVSIVLENPEEKQKIEEERGKILVANGFNWTTSSELYIFKQDLLDEDNNFLGLNYVIGPDLTEITDNAKFTLTGNPKDIEDKESFNFSLADKADCSISGNSKLKLKDYIIEANSQDGITFSDGTDSVSFTISELKQLKTLL